MCLWLQVMHMACVKEGAHAHIKLRNHQRVHWQPVQWKARLALFPGQYRGRLLNRLCWWQRAHVPGCAMLTGRTLVTCAPKAKISSLFSMAASSGMKMWHLRQTALPSEQISDGSPDLVQKGCMPTFKYTATEKA